MKERWQQPSPAQLQALGTALWDDLLQRPVKDLVTRPGLDAVLPLLLTEQAAQAVWRQVPREVLLEEARAVHASDLKVRDFLGEEAVAHLKATAGQGHKPNRQLIEKMLDQPYFKSALKNLVQQSIQQFLQQFRPGAGAKVPGGRVLGSVGRSIAHRAGRAAKAGKTLVEGIGGGIYRQLEEQLQPFLAGFMNRSVQTLGQVLFEGEEQARLAQEARLHVLEVILDAPISAVMPPPSEARFEQQLTLAQHVAAHLVRTDEHRARIQRVVHAIYQQWADKTIEEVLNAYALPVEPQTPLLEALGQLAFTLLTGEAVQRFLEQEVEGVW